MEAGAIRPGYELWRPNREKPEAKSARALVVFLLLVTAGLAFMIIIGGWTRLEGVKPLSVIYAGLYVLFAWFAPSAATCASWAALKSRAFSNAIDACRASPTRKSRSPWTNGAPAARQIAATPVT